VALDKLRIVRHALKHLRGVLTERGDGFITDLHNSHFTSHRPLLADLTISRFGKNSPILGGKQQDKPDPPML
jgi:hypothetical protein